MQLGWAIVSTGRHPDLKMAPAINAAADAELVAVVSRDLGRAREFAARHQARTAYDDFDAMLQDPAVDVVYLASPNFLHCQQTVKAAEAGKHVLCEKPMALTLEDCRLMVETCRQQDVRLGVGFHLRHHPGHQRMRELVQSGSLGTIAMAQAQWAYGVRGLEKPRPRTELQQWWEDPAMVGAGSWMGSGVHCADLLRYVLGREVVEVTAITDASDAEPLEHLATVLLRFEGGALGTAIASRKLPDAQNNLTVYGSLGKSEARGSLHVDLQGVLDVTTDALNEAQDYSSDPLALYVRQVEAFNHAVASGAEPVASGWDGLKVAEVTLAMVESARTGRKVRTG